MEEQNKIGFIFMGATLLIMVGMLGFGYKMYKDTRDRMDKMEEKFEKDRDERQADFNKSIENMTAITVPDVSGMKVGEAINILEEAGFVISDHRIIIDSEDIEEGRVVKTIPQAGSKRQKGTEVDLYISGKSE